MESFAWKPRRLTAEKLTERAGLFLALLLAIVAGLTVEWWGRQQPGSVSADHGARTPTAVDANARSGQLQPPSDGSSQSR